jgi:O-antigen ligase
MSITSIATAVLTLGALVAGYRPQWPRTGVVRPWMAWAIALCLAALLAIDPSGSLPRLKKALLPGLIVIAALYTREERSGRRALALLLLSSAVAAVYGIVFFLIRGASFAARARGPSGHYMTFAGQLLLLVAVAVPVAIVARERRWKWGAGATALLGGVALLGTFTRSSWIGLGVAFITTVSLLRPRWLPILVVLMAVSIAIAPPAIRDRLLSAVNPHHPTNVERVHMWEAGIRMFRDHPWTGVGLEDLHPIYERYRSPDAHEGAGHLHSVPIQIAATMGIVGLAAFVWLYGSLFAAAASGLRPLLRRRSVATGLKVGVVSALAGFLVAGLFEWNFGDEELLYLLYTLVGIAWSAGQWTSDPVPVEVVADHEQPMNGSRPRELTPEPAHRT